MSELTLVKHEFFDELKCDIYQGDVDYYMTREQIGTALEYAKPSKAIGNIHSRNKERLDKFSTVLVLRGRDGKPREATFYNRRGILEICRWSNQPKANALIDWVWDVMDSLIIGQLKIIRQDENIMRMIAESRVNQFSCERGTGIDGFINKT